uniref:Uncharacterized protein n=1 Tax=Rhizophora mucronata TaxID=61149 RepID=A0A2P2IKX3_RHIMU
MSTVFSVYFLFCIQPIHLSFTFDIFSPLFDPDCFNSTSWA